MWHIHIRLTICSKIFFGLQILMKSTSIWTDLATIIEFMSEFFSLRVLNFGVQMNVT